jgi:hypothetical protein
MQDKKTTEMLKYWLRMAIGVIVLLAGVTLAAMFAGSTSRLGILCENLGFAMTISGIVATFHEVVWRPITRTELREAIDNILESVKGPALHLETLVRRGFPGYHKWLVDSRPQTVFIAGHSVLHRMEDDHGRLPVKSIEEAISLKLSQGCNIRILFLDPTWDFLDRVANAQEGKLGEAHTQTSKKLRENLATSMEIVKRIADRLEKDQERLGSGSIDIKVCREVTQYAYHHVVCRETDSEEMFIGLYFVGELGTESPLFVIKSAAIRKKFEYHFTNIFGRATELLSWSRGDKQPRFNDEFYLRWRGGLRE